MFNHHNYYLLPQGAAFPSVRYLYFPPTYYPQPQQIERENHLTAEHIARVQNSYPYANTCDLHHQRLSERVVQEILIAEQTELKPSRLANAISSNNGENKTIPPTLQATNLTSTLDKAKAPESDRTDRSSHSTTSSIYSPSVSPEAELRNEIHLCLKSTVRHNLDQFQALKLIRANTRVDKEYPLEEIFQPNIFGRTVFLEGDAGSGKSELCAYMQAQWQKGALWQHIRYLFVLPVRDIPEDGEMQLIPLLDSLCLNNKSKQVKDKDFFNQVMKNILESKEVAIIFDGYDEKVTRRQGGQDGLTVFFASGFKDHSFYFNQDTSINVKNASLLVTTRPGHVEHFVDVDLRLRNVGFSEKSREEFVKLVIENQPESNRMLRFLRSHSGNEYFNPLIIKLYCVYLIFCNEEQPTSPLVDLYKKAVASHQKDLVSIGTTIDKLKQLAFNKMKQGDNTLVLTTKDLEDLGVDDKKNSWGSWVKRSNESKGRTFPLFKPQGMAAQYSFSHLTIQEYLAASYVAEKFEASENDSSLIKLWCQEIGYSKKLSFLAGLLRKDHLPAFFNLLSANLAERGILEKLRIILSCLGSLSDVQSIKRLVDQSEELGELWKRLVEGNCGIALHEKIDFFNSVPLVKKKYVQDVLDSIEGKEASVRTYNVLIALGAYTPEELRSLLLKYYTGHCKGKADRSKIADLLELYQASCFYLIKKSDNVGDHFNKIIHLFMVLVSAPDVSSALLKTDGYLQYFSILRSVKEQIVSSNSLEKVLKYCVNDIAKKEKFPPHIRCSSLQTVQELMGCCAKQGQQVGLPEDLESDLKDIYQAEQAKKESGPCQPSSEPKDYHPLLQVKVVQCLSQLLVVKKMGDQSGFSYETFYSFLKEQQSREVQEALIHELLFTLCVPSNDLLDRFDNISTNGALYIDIFLNKSSCKPSEKFEVLANKLMEISKGSNENQKQLFQLPALRLYYKRAEENNDFIFPLLDFCEDSTTPMWVKRYAIKMYAQLIKENRQVVPHHYWEYLKGSDSYYYLMKEIGITSLNIQEDEVPALAGPLAEKEYVSWLFSNLHVWDSDGWLKGFESIKGDEGHPLRFQAMMDQIEHIGLPVYKRSEWLKKLKEVDINLESALFRKRRISLLGKISFEEAKEDFNDVIQLCTSQPEGSRKEECITSLVLCAQKWSLNAPQGLDETINSLYESFFREELWGLRDSCSLMGWVDFQLDAKKNLDSESLVKIEISEVNSLGIDLDSIKHPVILCGIARKKYEQCDGSSDSAKATLEFLVDELLNAKALEDVALGTVVTYLGKLIVKVTDEDDRLKLLIKIFNKITATNQRSLILDSFDFHNYLCTFMKLFEHTIDNFLKSPEDNFNEKMCEYICTYIFDKVDEFQLEVLFVEKKCFIGNTAFDLIEKANTHFRDFQSNREKDLVR